MVIGSCIANIFPGTAVQILAGALDNAFNQPFQTSLGIQHVTETGNKVLRGHGSVLGALRGVPLGILADVEGVGYAVFADIPGSGQLGLHLAQVVVLHETVHGLHGDLGIALGGGVQPVQSDGSGGEGGLIISSQSVAQIGQELGRIINFLAGNALFPGGLHGFTVFLLDELGGGNHGAPAVVIVPPVDIGDRAVADAGNLIGTALGRVGDHDGAVQQVGFGLRLEDEALINGRSRFGFVHQGFEIAQNLFVDLIVVAPLIDDILSGRAHDGQQHRESQQQ